MKMVPLYEGAEKKSYYKFITPIEHIPDEEIKRVKGLVGQDPSLPPAFADRAIIQTDKYTPVPEGVYFMEDASMFISCVTPMPDVTGEMMDWWFAWHNLDPLRYTLWNPEDHYDVQVTDEDRAHILDDSLPVRERAWGIVSTVTESWNGEEPTVGPLHFTEPGTVGLSNDLIGTPKCQSILVANNSTKKGPIEVPVYMCEWLRENDEGKNEWVVAAWMGHGVKNGKEVKFHIPKPLMKVMAEKMGAMFIAHSHKEMAHLNEILPGLYAEQKDNWLE